MSDQALIDSILKYAKMLDEAPCSKPFYIILDVGMCEKREEGWFVIEENRYLTEEDISRINNKT